MKARVWSVGSCPVKPITASATLVAFIGTVGFASSRGYGLVAQPIAAGATALGLALLAWVASSHRYAPVSLLCAGAALVPWTDGWAGNDGSTSPGAGLMTLGVLLTSFISANSKAELRSAWEQCAPAAAAASGWLVAMALVLTLAAESLDLHDGFGPWFLWLGAAGFFVLALLASKRVKQRIAQGEKPSPYMSGRDFTTVLVLKFLGGSCYVGLALVLVVSGLAFHWVEAVGGAYPRSGTETFPPERTNPPATSKP